jgi:indole-3-glycerol phosphate synthase
VKNKLDEIMAYKRREVERLAPHADELRKLAVKRDDFRGFRAALHGHPRVGLIAEVKKASPSAGVIASDFDPVRQAREYERGGAHCLSVLTDENYFQGHLMHLTRVREQVRLPVLRKDFIVHRHQIYEALVAGADCLLLIVAGLKPEELRDLYNESRDLQVDVLVEVHDLREMDAALDLGADFIGINNRSLQTFEVSIGTTEALAEEAPPDVVLVSESGIRTRADVDRVVEAGADAILVGETLMRARHVPDMIRELVAE